MNAFAKLAFAAVFNVTKEQVDDYTRNKPLAAIVFHNVGAATAQDAMQGIRPLVDDVALALAFERGQAPEPFASIVANGADLTMWLLHRRYTANFAAPLSSSETGEQIEWLTKAMAQSPFSKLLLELYVQAISDSDKMFQIFRYWAILDLLAKRAIPGKNDHIIDAYGQRILLSNGNPVTTRSAEAKVYKYLFEKGGGGGYSIASKPSGPFSIIIEGTTPAPQLSGNGVRLTFWELIQAFYEVRNGIAHEGRFSPDPNAEPNSRKGLARLVMELPDPHYLHRYAQETAKTAVISELYRARSRLV